MVYSNRIKTAAYMVTTGGTVADIGCDHCLSLIYLINEGKCTKGIACDINKGPLERGRQNVTRAGLLDKIELRLGNGLLPLTKGEADTILIAGIGGQLMCGIINEGISIAKDASFLVLQPHKDVPLVRECLHTQGLKIIDEEMIYDEGQYYVTIKATPGIEHYDNKAFYLFGKILIERKSAVLKQYLMSLHNKNKRLIEKLSDKNTENCVIKLTEAVKLDALVAEVLLWL